MDLDNTQVKFAYGWLKPIFTSAPAASKKKTLDPKVVKIDSKIDSRFVNLNPWYTLYLSFSNSYLSIVNEIYHSP